MIEAFRAEDVAIRRDFHRHPELGYAERRTSGIVRRHLEHLGIEHCGGLAGGTGVLGFLPATVNADAAKTVALRADMDALPILEDSDVEYRSATDGVMHACGHDGHTTILMATARALHQIEARPNHVLFVFQPAEEGGAGGHKMCEDGVLSGKVLGPKADMIFGLHGNPWLELGHVSTRVGPIMASANEIQIEVHGKGSHAAYPHLGIDPVLVCAHIVTALQSIASRNVDPLDSVVVTIGKVEAGSAHNVIADSAKLTGTFRTLRNATTEFVQRRITQIAQDIASAFGAVATATFPSAYPVTINDPSATETFRRVAATGLPQDLIHEEVHPSMGAEDFSFYGREVPACFFFLGLRPATQPSYPNLHAPQFDFNDDAMPTGIDLFCRLALAA